MKNQSITPLVKIARQAYQELQVAPTIKLHASVTKLIRAGRRALRARASATRDALLHLICEALRAARHCILLMPATFGLRDLGRINRFLQTA